MRRFVVPRAAHAAASPASAPALKSARLLAARPRPASPRAPAASGLHVAARDRVSDDYDLFGDEDYKPPSGARVSHFGLSR